MSQVYVAPGVGPAQNSMNGIDRYGNFFQPLSADGPLFDYLKFLDPGFQRTYIFDAQLAQEPFYFFGIRVSDYRPTDCRYRFEFEAGMMAALRAFSLCKFVPFAAPYFCYYNSAAAAAKFTITAIYLFREEKPKAAEWAAKAVQHVAFAGYNFALCFLVVVPTVLNIPIVLLLFALTPQLLDKARIWVTAPFGGLLTARVTQSVYRVINQQPPGEQPPALLQLELPRIEEPRLEE
jgi:hypothetical protein